MTVAEPQKNAADLLADARSAAELHDEIVRDSQGATRKAMRVGELLNKIKAACEHGRFSFYVSKSGIPHRTCNKYMLLARFAGHANLRGRPIDEAHEEARLLAGRKAKGKSDSGRSAKRNLSFVDSIMRLEKLARRIEKARIENDGDRAAAFAHLLKVKSIVERIEKTLRRK